MEIKLTSPEKIFPLFLSHARAKHFDGQSLLLKHFYLNLRCKFNADDFNFEIQISNLTDPKKSHKQFRGLS